MQAVRGSQRVTDQNPEAKFQALERYGIDLIERARQGKLDPVIGRDQEIRRVIQVLSRRTKNNPVLIGEPGVGKTAIVEGPGPADRRRRRAREPQEPPRRGPGHGRAGGRHEVPRRVRGAAQGRTEGSLQRRQRRALHRRTAHGRRRRPAPKAAATPPICSSRPWPAANSAASAPRRSTSIASTSRRTPPWSGVSNRSPSASRTSRTRSPSSAA